MTYNSAQLIQLFKLSKISNFCHFFQIKYPYHSAQLTQLSLQLMLLNLPKFVELYKLSCEAGISIYINKTRLSPITQFFKHNFLFLYRFHCYTDHQEFDIRWIYIYKKKLKNISTLMIFLLFYYCQPVSYLQGNKYVLLLSNVTTKICVTSSKYF